MSLQLKTRHTLQDTRPSALSSELLASELTRLISTLYSLAQTSAFVFGSPLGAVKTESKVVTLPRFVYFGPGTTDASLRLSFLTGFNREEVPLSLSLLSFVRDLSLSPDLGQSLHLAFFPVVDTLGILGGQESTRDLTQADWVIPEHQDIALLQHDARVMNYHGFVRLGLHQEDTVSVELITRPATAEESPGVELLSSEDIGRDDVRFSSEDAGRSGPQKGPIGLSDDLVVQPFELRIFFPASWRQPALDAAVSRILKQFILRHRALMAYAQHL